MNDHKAREMQRLIESRRFQEAVQMGQVGAVDRLGVAILPGQRAIYAPPHDLMFDVKDVKPVLDPKFPPGTVLITLASVCTVMVMANQPQMNMISVAGERVSRPEPADEDEPPTPPRLVLAD